jgi:hypothetical protein
MDAYAQTNALEIRRLRERGCRHCDNLFAILSSRRFPASIRRA